LLEIALNRGTKANVIIVVLLDTKCGTVPIDPNLVVGNVVEVVRVVQVEVVVEVVEVVVVAVAIERNIASLALVQLRKAGVIAGVRRKRRTKIEARVVIATKIRTKVRRKKKISEIEARKGMKRAKKLPKQEILNHSLSKKNLEQRIRYQDLDLVPLRTKNKIEIGTEIGMVIETTGIGNQIGERKKRNIVLKRSPERSTKMAKGKNKGVIEVDALQLSKRILLMTVKRMDPLESEGPVLEGMLRIHD